MNPIITLLIFACVILPRGGFATPLLATEPSADSPPVIAIEPPAMRDIGPDEFLQLMTDALQRDHVAERGELEIQFTRPPAPMRAPEQAIISLRVLELPTLGVTSHFVARFELFADGQSLGAGQAAIRARIWRDVWVAVSLLRRGDVVSSADRTLERRDVLTTRDVYVTADRDETMLEFSENIQPGAPILARSIRPRTLVRRGQMLAAVVRDGSMAISLKVEALEDGALGQQVRVRNVQSKREFRGKVENENTVSVSL